MIRDRDFKLIYYPCGNVVQLFNLKNDPKETCDLADLPEYRNEREKLEAILMENMHDVDETWIREGKLVGFEAPSSFTPKIDFGLYNQRGYHWPAPKGYSNLGKNA